jgi:outer membrane lipoprotein SlyB
MNRLIQTLLAAATAYGLVGCATSNPDVVRRGETQRMSTVVDAVVLNTRQVVVDGSQTGVGAATGGVIGGMAGGSVGGRRDSVVAGVIGAVVGGVIGNAVERNATREEALEIVVQLRNGDRRAIVQARASESFAPGDPVILINTGGRVRVAKAPSIAPAAGLAAPPAASPAALPAPTAGPRT